MGQAGRLTRLPPHICSDRTGGRASVGRIEARRGRRFYTRRTLWFVIFSGVFHRHPGLELVLTEQRVGWVPFTLDYLDSIYDSPRTMISDHLPLRPSEYLLLPLPAEMMAPWPSSSSPSPSATSIPPKWR